MEPISAGRKKFEGETADFLRAYGCSVDIAWPHVIWIFRDGKRIPINKQVDFHGFFDLDAVHGEIMRKIQVSTGTRRSLNQHKQKLEGWTHDTRPILWHFWKIRGRWMPEILVRIDGQWEQCDIFRELALEPVRIERVHPWYDFLVPLKLCLPVWPIPPVPITGGLS